MVETDVYDFTSAMKKILMSACFLFFSAAPPSAEGNDLCGLIFSMDFLGAGKLLEQGVRIDEISRDARSTGLLPLQCADMARSRETVDSLLARGAKADAVGKAGTYALLTAAENDDTGILLSLLQAGARPNVKRSSDGMTPLMLAASKGNAEAVQLLLAHGADRLTRDRRRRTASDIAHEEGHSDLALILAASQLRRVSLPKEETRSSAQMLIPPPKPAVKDPPPEPAAKNPPQPKPTAEEMLRDEAEKGDAKARIRLAQYNLAALYDRGLGVGRDRVEAYKWLRLSTLLSDHPARTRRAGDYFATLTPAQRKQANRGIKGWFSAHGRALPPGLEKAP